MRILKDESGQVAIFAALFLGILFLGIAALAIDVGMLYRTKRIAQTAADAAALAASAQYPTDINASASGAAYQQSGIVSSGTNKATVTPVLLNASSSDVQVTVTQPASTFFMGTLGSRFGTIRVSAIAEAARPPASSCLTALSPSGVSASSSPIWGSGTGGIMAGNGGSPSPQIKVTGCGICSNSAIIGFSNGTGISTDKTANGAGGVTGKVTATGGTSTKGGCSNTFSAVVPPVYAAGCQGFPWDSNPNGGQKGVLNANPNGPAYCDFNTQKLGSLELTGGLYIFAHNFNLGGGVAVTEDAPVTLFFAPGINLNGGNGSNQYGFDNGTNINITAPSIGPYAGIVIWDNNTSATPDTFTWNGGNQTIINGSIYAPNTNIQIGNGSGASAVNGGVIANTIMVGGGGGLSINKGSNGGGSSGQVGLVR